MYKRQARSSEENENDAIYTWKTGGTVSPVSYTHLVIQVVLRMGLSTDDLKLLTALVVALFLAMPYWKGRYFTKHGKGQRKGGGQRA